MLIEQASIEKCDVWLDDRNVHSMSSQLKSQCFRQAFNGVFGTGINRQTRLRIVSFTRQASYIDDASWKKKWEEYAVIPSF